MGNSNAKRQCQQLQSAAMTALQEMLVL